MKKDGSTTKKKKVTKKLEGTLALTTRVQTAEGVKRQMLKKRVKSTK